MFKHRTTRKALRSLGLFLIRLMLVGLMVMLPTQLFASIAPDPPIPTTVISLAGQYARVPDWAQITFRTLPPILSGGIFESPSEINRQMGYDLSRRWEVGQTADTYLKLGDFQTSLYPQIFNLYSIAQIANLDLEQVALSAFETITWQTLDDLVMAIPGLGGYEVADIPVLWDLMRGHGDRFPGTPPFNPNATLAEVLNVNPNLGQLSLGELGDQLDQFTITDIPGLENVPLQNLRNWGDSFISGVPGLADVPLNQMPNPIANLGIMGVVDMVYGPAEQDRRNTISGGDQVGFSATCQADCAHVELTGNPTLHGKQWISGKYQEVKGGFGVLGAANGGKEPTGRHPFGKAFKLSVWDVDESTGNVSTALHFRICYRGIPDLGCTPYFLGPVPFLSYRETEPIFVGLLDLRGGASSPVAIPEGVFERAKALGIPAAALPGLSAGFFGGGSLCGEGPGGVNFKALAAAFSSIEGDYGSVGSFVCDGMSNCGRGLGRYQYMSYRSDIRRLISRRQGGATFLAKVDSGAAISRAELERFFPSTGQDGVFKADQTRNIEQAIREGFSGERLIERVGQIHFGGSGAPLDGGTSDVHGRLTLKSYGETLGEQYDTALKAQGASACGKATGSLVNPTPNAHLTSDYGWRIHPIYRDRRFHTGIDLGAPTGTPVRAADGGTVVFVGVSGSMTSGYGQMVIIDHGNGHTTRYAHLSGFDVKEGDQIARGDQLGRVGSTGGSTGPHLHFEVRRNGAPVNPRQYINI